MEHSRKITALRMLNGRGRMGVILRKALPVGGKGIKLPQIGSFLPLMQLRTVALANRSNRSAGAGRFKLWPHYAPCTHTASNLPDSPFILNNRIALILCRSRRCASAIITAIKYRTACHRKTA